MPFTSTRTVRTITIGSDGKQRVETKTFSDGDEDGESGRSFGFNTRFGGMNIRMGGGDDGGRRGMSCYRSTQRPQVDGRSTRKEKKNPFAGLNHQSYDEIVKRCKEEGILFEDPEFEAEDSSIFFSRSPPRPFEWKRPTELCDNPMYVSSGASRFDVQQGELGDCWLLAAVASLTCNHHLLNKVIIPEQDFTGPNYVGCFKFLFWHQGDWIEVVVDDRLPTYYNKLVFMHSADQNEFWSALLEKAYAKINGSYESLKGGSTSEAMEDFTGGVTESVDLKDRKPELLTIMMKAFARGSLMGCSIEADPNQLEAILDNGLVMGHAYSVTAVKLVEIQTPKVSGKIPMVRVRNPWGNESEWNGAWSDKSQEWRYIPEEEKQALGLTFDDDGEFWMSFEDWQSNFQKLEICNLGPDSLDEEESASGKIRWEATAEKGEWIPRVNAGGCRNYLDTFATNPQYRVVLTDPDDDEDDLCTILIGLLQKDRRKKRKEGLDMLTMGYVIYKMKEDGTYGNAPLDTRFFKYNASCAKSPSFINMREVCGRHKLSPGTYVIIPSTFEPNQSGEFLLRIFTEKPGTTSDKEHGISAEMDEGTAIVEDQSEVIGFNTGITKPSGYVSRPTYNMYAGSGGFVLPSYVAGVAAAPTSKAPQQHVRKPGPNSTDGRDGMQYLAQRRPPSPIIKTYNEAIVFLKQYLDKEPVPVTEEDKQQGQAIKEAFKQIAGEDMEIDASELKEILNKAFQSEFKFDGFSIDVCRSMIAMHDGDLSGKLGFDEFKDLWNDVRRWKTIFKKYDRDNSGKLSSYELRDALHASGFRLSNRTLSAIILRYSDKTGQMEFDDFILCAIRLKTMITSFRGLDTNNEGVAVYDLETFIQTTLYS